VVEITATYSSPDMIGSLQAMNVTLVNLGFPDYPVALANALARRVNLTFIQAARLTDPWQAQIDPNIHLLVRGLPRIRDPRSLAAVLALLRNLCNLKPDILHLQDSVNPWFDLVAASHDLPPMVVTVHDATRHPGENRGEWFTGYLRKRLLLRARAVIVHASIQRDLLCSRWGIPRDRVHVVQHGEMGSLYRAATTGKPGEIVQRNPESVLFFGRVLPYKGLGILIDAMKIVRKTIPDAKLIIAGRGGQVARSPLVDPEQTWVEIIDRFIPHAEVVGLFSRAGMAVLPYVEASQSGVASLAMGLGTPVIASAIGGLQELIVDGVDGILVPPEDATALALATMSLMRDENLPRRLSSAASMRSQSDLAWSSIADETVRLYKHALDVQ
jgi:glycosyltransferase involved in cell wall biosynthesis